MPVPLPGFNGFVLGVVLLTLSTIDYLLGNGFADMFQVLFCKILCVVKKTIREEAKQALLPKPEVPINMPMLFTEMILLFFTFLCLNKFKKYQCKDQIDELLQESKDALKQTNEFLEKWRLRKVPTEYSYLDEDPQEIKPLKLEVPILHMAIIDSFGTTKIQLERGDAGDVCNTIDSILLSVTSLLDDDLESESESPSKEVIGEASSIKNEDISSRNVELNSRYLWDVTEEDSHTNQVN